MYITLIRNPDKSNYGKIMPLVMSVFNTDRREIRELINDFKLDMNPENVSVICSECI